MIRNARTAHQCIKTDIHNAQLIAKERITKGMFGVKEKQGKQRLAYLAAD